MNSAEHTNTECSPGDGSSLEALISDATVQARLVALHGKDFAAEVGAVAAAEYALSSAVLQRSSALSLVMFVLALWSIGLLLLSLAYVIAVEIGAGWCVALVIVNLAAVAGVAAAFFGVRHYAGQAGFKRTRALVSHAFQSLESNEFQAPAASKAPAANKEPAAS